MQRETLRRNVPILVYRNACGSTFVFRPKADPNTFEGLETLLPGASCALAFNRISELRFDLLESHVHPFPARPNESKLNSNPEIQPACGEARGTNTERTHLGSFARDRAMPFPALLSPDECGLELSHEIRLQKDDAPWHFH